MKFTYTSGSRPLEGYTIKRGVGSGGFGEVYYALSDGGKEVALKLVQRNLDVELRGVAQCMNLKHPNLVTLYDLRTNEVGEHFVVMEFVAGKSLSEILEEHPNGLSLDDVNRWLKGISAGIGYLHDKGIVHRDLKPGNVFIEDGVVKIGDYGLSKFITASRRSGQTESVGTVHYMAPEISRGKYDREIDVYASGIMLYEMITGHVPFDGESVGEILMKHLTAQPDVSKLPAPYDLVAQRALAKDPVERFRTMEEFAASLNGRLAAASGLATLKETIPFASPPPDVSPVAAAFGTGASPAATATKPISPPIPVFGSGNEDNADWLHRMRAKAIAWYERPWSMKDYFLAALCLLAIATAGTAAMGGILALLPGAIVAVGIALIVNKLSRKHSIQPAAASPMARPIVLNPVHVASPAAASPVIMTAAMATPEPPTPPSPVQPIRMSPVPRPHAPRELLPKPIRTRLVEMTSAMLLTTVLSVIAAVLAAGLMRLHKLEECALLAATCLAGCWAVLIPAKIWEGQQGDAMLRRLVMAAIGVGVGAWSSYLDGVMNVGWLNDSENAPALFESMEWMPRMLADASFFGLVFLIPRWWLIADSRRPLKFNPWMVMVPCFWAWMVSSLWIRSYYNPVFWGVVVIGLVAGLVQLATPWEDPASRRRVV